ncbi:MAG: hypothetical protein A2W80_14965 [Candidatus Riflebacteria bacterium GWC2_50_8]|nr:MAG: hypothetical protein A2W80_14965 [Candidatus Riflebacteria bacterium GWC2_50_8]
MPLFRYSAYDKSGVETSGVIDADDAAGARQAVKLSGLAPFEIELAGEQQGLHFSRGFSLSEQARLSRQLGALLKGGVPLTRALAGLEVQEAWQSRRQIIVQIREGVEKGRDISTVIGDIGAIFSPTMLAVIRVGETTGRLDFAFAQMASHLDREMEHRRRLLAAIAYPAVTAVISVGVLAFLMVYLVPTIARMFADVQGELPWITQILIASSNFFSEYWLYISISLLVLVVSAHFALKLAAMRRNFELLELGIPIWGRFSQGMKMESWARNTGMMVECGVTLLESVRILRDNSSSLLQHDALTSVEKSLERGTSFSEALGSSNFFPVFLLQMIEAGEASGELPAMLKAVASDLEADNRVLTELFLNVLEPLLIVIMGGVVGAIMVGVLLPIYEMNRFL